MRLYLFFVLLLASLSAQAERYYWKHGDSPYTADNPALILSWWTTNMPASGAWTLADTKITLTSETSVKLEAWWTSTDPKYPGAWTYTYSSAVRFGDSCADDEDYSSSEYKCIPKPADCTSTAGQTAYHLSRTGKTRPTPNDPWPAGSVTGDPTMCSGSCRYTLAQATNVQCGTVRGGDPLAQFCLFEYRGTGEQCGPTDPKQNNGSTSPVPPTDPADPTDPANNCGPTHVWSGSTCVPKLDPDPSDPTDPTDPGGGDPGGGNPGGGDPGGGDPGGGDPGGGDPGGGDPGDGEDGIKGLACDEPLTCEGDAMTCAQLTLQKALKCDAEDATDFPEQKDEISDFLKNPAYRMEEDEEVNISSYFKEGTRFLPSSCPPPKVFHLTTGGGRTFQFSYESICLFASDLGFLIVAAAGVFFAIYVGRAAGGE